MRLFDIAISSEWAIRDEHALRAILSVLAREDVSSADLAAALGTHGSLEAVQAQKGGKLEYSRTMTVRDGVAIIPVEGPIARRASFFSDFSGGTSIAALALDLHNALNDPSIHSLLLNIDSPGGTVSGTSELADMIYAARGKKPIVAYVGGLGASAAYWLGSAADEIVAEDTAIIGSIGVIAIVPDSSKQTSKDIEIVSSNAPLKRVDASTESGRAVIQTQVDDLAQVFVARVARQRGVSTDKVLSDFGRGDAMIASKALAVGMIDRIGSFEQTVADLQTRRRQQMHSHTASSRSKRMGEEPQAQSQVEAEAKRDAEMLAMRSELTKLRGEVIRKDAEAFASILVAAHQALPAEHGAIASLVVQAKLDDAERPMAEGSREALVRSAYASRPAHNLTGELVPDNSVQSIVAAHNAIKPADLDSDPVDEQRRKDLLGRTQLGADVLSSKK